MLKQIRSFLGLRSSSSRKVVGSAISFDSKELDYIKQSNKRLTDLYDLAKQYRGTLHEPKLRTVYDKTKKIHGYLIAQKRVHELELFHLQQTDHFINTFTAIINVHKEHHEPVVLPPSKPVVQERVSIPKLEANQHKEVTFNPQPASGTIISADTTGEGQLASSKLVLPVAFISPAIRVVYAEIPTTKGNVTREVGFTSTKHEKDSFLKFIISQLGIYDITYLGNALLVKAKGSAQVALPILKWRGNTYALDLDDFKLYPVHV